MKIDIKQFEGKETLMYVGNRLFTKEQIKEIKDA